MSPVNKRYRWFVLASLFTFMLLHQSDKLLIGPLTPNIIAEFDITKTQMGAVLTGALLISTILYPIWGYLFDRYSRAKLLALASFVWGVTTWLSAVARTYPGFLAARASTGVDDSSYPGVYSLIADYFGPKMRGKIFGTLQITIPLGYLMGLILALVLAPVIGWRSVFYLTGGLGVILAAVIFVGVKETTRGRAEPELAELAEMGQYRFSWVEAKEIFQKPSIWFLYLQGFAGVFPWNVISLWFFTYLAEERGYDETAILLTMVPVIVLMSIGMVTGGAAGDWLFKRTLRGRVIVGSAGVLLGAIFIFFALNTPVEARTTFFILTAITALFLPLSGPNTASTIYDMTLPEVRSTAMAVQFFVENSGAALSPLLAGYIADRSDLGTAILWISIIAWGLCFLFYLGAMWFLPADIRQLRQQLIARASYEQTVHTAA